jgi:hypothetical protein
LGAVNLVCQHSDVLGLQLGTARTRAIAAKTSKQVTETKSVVQDVVQDEAVAKTVGRGRKVVKAGGAKVVSQAEGLRDTLFAARATWRSLDSETLDDLVEKVQNLKVLKGSEKTPKQALEGGVVDPVEKGVVESVEKSRRNFSQETSKSDEDLLQLYLAYVRFKLKFIEDGEVYVQKALEDFVKVKENIQQVIKRRTPADVDSLHKQLEEGNLLSLTVLIF